VRANAIVSTATQVSAIPAATASSSGRVRFPVASRPAAAIGRVIRPVTSAADCGLSRRHLAAGVFVRPEQGDADADRRDDREDRRPAAARQRPPGEQARHRDADEQRAAEDHLHGEQRPGTQRRGVHGEAAGLQRRADQPQRLPGEQGEQPRSAATSVGVRAACRCSTATPAPYSTADNAANSNVVIPRTLLISRFDHDGPTTCLGGGVTPPSGGSATRGCGPCSGRAGVFARR
jgi:hypothetical protein